MYKVVDTFDQVDVKVGFATREEAKVLRNELNAGKLTKKEAKEAKLAKNDAKPRYVVSRGPNHPNGETDGFDHTSRSKFE